MKTRIKSVVPCLAAGAMFVTTIAAPSAFASEQGKRNTAIGLGAASAALLLTQRNALPGLLVGGGALYAYGEYQKDVNRRHRRERLAAYRHGYGRGYYTASHRRRRYHTASRSRAHHAG